MRRLDPHGGVLLMLFLVFAHQNAPTDAGDVIRSPTPDRALVLRMRTIADAELCHPDLRFLSSAEEGFGTGGRCLLWRGEESAAITVVGHGLSAHP